MIKTVYFDRNRGRNGGRWTTIEKRGIAVQFAEYRCERDARASIGLAGGSADPGYQPATGTGCEQVDEQGFAARAD